MALHCPHCNSTDTQALADCFQCLTCGLPTRYDADLIPDDVTIDVGVPE